MLWFLYLLSGELQMKSIICSDKKCFICGSTKDLEKHHCLFGTANRQKADSDGLWVWLCHECHHGIHNGNIYAKTSLEQKAQKAWLLDDYDRSINDFIERYGRNYL